MSDDRMARLADESEIRSLTARLAHLADFAADLTEYLSLFTEDGVWEYSEASRAQVTAPREGLSVKGRAAIAADRGRLRADRFQGPGTKTYHVNTTLAVRVLSDTAAETESYWLFVDAKGEPKLSRIGHYHDTWRRTADGWKLAHRVVTPASM
jgi:ketosteroid isomerase-like protein